MASAALVPQSTVTSGTASAPVTVQSAEELPPDVEGVVPGLSGPMGMGTQAGLFSGQRMLHDQIAARVPGKWGQPRKPPSQSRITQKPPGHWPGGFLKWGLYFVYSRHRNVTIWARVHLPLGLNVVSVVPWVTPLSTVQATASAQ